METRVLIIEDEKSNSKRLTRLLSSIDAGIQIVAVIESVEDAVNWLSENKAPDLLFMDVQLSDGLCFEIFDSVSILSPIIFTTAYDEYALKAFKVNSIDYLLKPVDPSELSKAIEKFKHFFGAGSGKESSSLEHLIKSLYPEKPNYKNRFLVKQRNKYISISTPEVSCFVLLNQLVYLYARDGRKFLIDMMLDELEATLDPGKFFRVNRQSIINTESISAIEIYAGKRLRIYPEGKPEVEIIVSREKVAQFKVLMDS